MVTPRPVRVSSTAMPLAQLPSLPGWPQPQSRALTALDAVARGGRRGAPGIVPGY